MSGCGNLSRKLGLYFRSVPSVCFIPTRPYHRSFVATKMAKSSFLDDISILPKLHSDSPLRHPAPRIPHVVLDHDAIGDKQVFVVGDVHGCFNELRELLDKVGIGTGNANVVTIFVGDLINKGPKNREVLELVRRLGAYSVRGNHDQKCVRNLGLLREGKPIVEKFQWLSTLTDDDYRHLMELPYSISLPSLKSIVVHACLVPGIPITSQDPVHLMIMRNLVKLGRDVQSDDADSSLDTQPLYKPMQSSIVGKPWASLWPGPDHVYFGHDAKRGLQRFSYATGLDTGCVYGRRLTGVFLTGDKQLVQVRAKRAHCEADGPLVVD